MNDGGVLDGVRWGLGGPAKLSRGGERQRQHGGNNGDRRARNAMVNHETAYRDEGGCRVLCGKRHLARWVVKEVRYSLQILFIGNYLI
jgi:hypothetical protein